MTYKETLEHRDQAIKRAGEEYAIIYMEGLNDGYKMGVSEIICPFCEQDGFDKSGYKYHLQVYCDDYINTKT